MDKIYTDALYVVGDEDYLYVAVVQEIYRDECYHIGEEKEGDVYVYVYHEWDGFGPMHHSSERIPIEDFLSKSPVLIETNFSDSFENMVE